jgi:hypothetical protein
MEWQSIKASGANGGGAGRADAPGAAAAGAARSSGEPFAASFLQLRTAMGEACAPHTEWEARVVAGVSAALEFAAASPAAARAVFVRGRGEGSGESDRQDEVIAYFTQLLEGVAPTQKRFAIATDQAIVESVATMIRAHLLGGTGYRLPELAADVVYLVLMPYTGLEGARRWAKSVDPRGQTGTDEYELPGSPKQD